MAVSLPFIVLALQADKEYHVGTMFQNGHHFKYLHTSVVPRDKRESFVPVKEWRATMSDDQRRSNTYQTMGEHSASSSQLVITAPIDWYSTGQLSVRPIKRREPKNESKTKGCFIVTGELRLDRCKAAMTRSRLDFRETM